MKHRQGQRISPDESEFMSQTSPRLTLPFIQLAQAQKHVTHNKAVRALDLLVQLSFEDDALTAPPAAPSEGECISLLQVPQVPGAAKRP